MDKKNETLTEAQKQFAYIAIVILLLAVTYFSFPQKSKIVAGTVQTINAIPTEEGNKIFWMVRLDSGELVKVYVSNQVFLKQNQRIAIAEITSVIGFKKYRFSKVSDIKHNKR